MTVWHVLLIQLTEKDIFPSSHRLRWEWWKRSTVCRWCHHITCSGVFVAAHRSSCGISCNASPPCHVSRGPHCAPNLVEDGERGERGGREREEGGREKEREEEGERGERGREERERREGRRRRGVKPSLLWYSCIPLIDLSLKHLSPHPSSLKMCYCKHWWRRCAYPPPLWEIVQSLVSLSQVFDCLQYANSRLRNDCQVCWLLVTTFKDLIHLWWISSKEVVSIRLKVAQTTQVGVKCKVKDKRSLH